MRLRLAAFVLPALVVYTTLGMAWRTGAARGPVVLLCPEYRGDESRIRHELVHVAQWYGVGAVVTAMLVLAILVCPFPAYWASGVVGFMAHPMLYALHSGYRLWAEIHAYREQMRWPDKNGYWLTLEGAAGDLDEPGYGFHIDNETAKALLA